MLAAVVHLFLFLLLFPVFPARPILVLILDPWDFSETLEQDWAPPSALMEALEQDWAPTLALILDCWVLLKALEQDWALTLALIS